MISRLRARIWLVIMLSACPFAVQQRSADANGIGWTPPLSISGDLAGPSQFPKIAQDSAGNLHVIWMENSYDDRGVADAVYYSTFDGVSWSSPVDVLVPPDQTRGSSGELVVLPGNELALLWTGGQQILFSTVAVPEAHQASSWRTTPLFPEYRGQKPFMVYVPPATLYVIFVDSTTFGVMFTSSDDLGASWTEPVEIWAPPTDGFAADDPRLCFDAQGTMLHAVWHDNAREENWNPSGIWYMRSLDQGVTWSDSFYLQNQGSSPNCAYDGEGKLHMLWNNAVDSVDGRYHRWSTNDGKDWSEAVPVFPGLSGRTRAPAMATDGLGVLYALTGAQTVNTTQMFVSHWQGDSWSIPFSISEDLDFNESPDMVVTGGNRLNAVWHIVNRDLSNIWYSTVETEAPAIAASPPDIQPTPSPVPSSTPVLAQAPTTTITPLEEPVSTIRDYASTSPPQATPISPILAGVFSGLLVTTLAIAGVVWSRRRR